MLVDSLGGVPECPAAAVVKMQLRDKAVSRIFHILFILNYNVVGSV